jgi:hydroxyacyl-ACP dehydratase HTD2-like protein with hotdog domain
VTLAEHLSGWAPAPVSRRERFSAGPVGAMAALLDQPSPAREDGDPVPPGWHRLYLLDWPQQHELGPDGHPAAGGFLPPVPERRRMYAGGRLEIAEPLRVGDVVTRTSRLARVEVKRGSTGELAFVTIRDELTVDGATAIIDEQDLVYRSGAPSSAGTAPEQPPRATGSAGAPGMAAEWEFSVTPDPVLLFRFSALTANAHRIHYDERYATTVEGFAGLLVHGPLLALLLLELPRRHAPGSRVARFGYRARRPVIAGEPVVASGERGDTPGSWNLAVRAGASAAAMTGHAVLA